MKRLKEWHFDFVLLASEDGQLVFEDEASALLDSIIAYVEERGLAIAGGMGPHEDTE